MKKNGSSRRAKKPPAKPSTRSRTPAKRGVRRSVSAPTIRIPVHVHPYGTDMHRDLDWHTKKFQKLTRRLPEDGQRTVERALQVSKERHEGQTRLGGSPYIIHPLRIANILMGEWNVTDPSVVGAALLHDVVEDTQTTIKEVKDLFGDQIGKLVDGMTMWKGSETYEIYCRRVSRGPETLRLIKCADALDNLRSWHETDASPEGLTLWWRQVNDHVLPIADNTFPQAATTIRSLLQDRWFLRMANME